jgi:hypothetical protein
MDDAERPIRFPVELEQALEHIRLLAHRRAQTETVLAAPDPRG